MTIVLNNIRSAWNVGAIMRTCDSLGADLVLVGYTPKPTGETLRLIKKTAIGAEETVKWQHFDHWQDVFENYPEVSHIGIEISDRSRNIFEFLGNHGTPPAPQNHPLGLRPPGDPVNRGELGYGQFAGDQSSKKNLPPFQGGVGGGTSPEGAEDTTVLLWFGNEIHGLEEKLCERLDHELHLPMLGMKESLNVASTVCAVGYLFLGLYYR